MPPTQDTPTPMAARGSALAELRDDASSRKRFLRTIGGGGAVAALGTLLAACGDDDSDSGSGGSATTPQTTGTTGAGGAAGGDLAIVSYALTLEYLEADFYKQVIDSGLIKDKAVADIAKKFGESEQAHVDALIAVVEQLGGDPVPVPETNFQPVLDGGVEMILQTAATVENVGAAAYLGQAGNIQSKEILAAALSIHSVEARHAAALNELVGRGFKGDDNLQGSIPDGAFAEPLDMDAVLEQIQPFLA